jgi:uncharacterized membrane protein YfhO
LFLPEYYDAGWKASVDGEEACVIRANASFRAIPIKKGQHIVNVYYSPGIFYIGLFLSALTILFAIVFLFSQHIMKKSNAIPPID